MSYNKVIVYGHNFELYQYEKFPSLFRSNRKNASNDVSSGFRDGGGDMLGSGMERVNRTSVKRRDNAKRASMAFRRLVSCNLKGCENPLLLTFTYRENKTDVSEALADFRSFVQSLRYKFGQTFRYVCVPEFQRRGAVHFHALFWGIQKEVLGIQRRYPDNSIDCYYWSYGFLFVKDTNGHEKLSNYLAKYMVKSFLDPRLVGKKAYVSSKNILKPVVVKGLSSFSLSCVMDDYLGVDNYCVQSRSYMTEWLGQCDYKLFKIN